MRYKLLMNRRKSAMVNDIFSHNEFGLDCFTTSERREDMVNHLEYMRPHVFLCFLERENELLIEDLVSLRVSGRYSDTEFVIAGDSADVEYFRKKAPGFHAEYIRLPVSVFSLADTVRRICVDNFGEIPPEVLEAAAENARRINKPQTAEPAAETADDDEIIKRHILVVDDDRNILKMLKAALEPEYDVTTMINGTMALKFLETRTVDLILLDYEMPLITGSQVLKRLKARPECADIPVIFLTGVTDPKKIMEVMAQNPSDYILKPIDIERLKAAVEEYIRPRDV